MEAYLRHERRLLLPVGSCDQFGPHLPLGADGYVASALARDLAEAHGLLYAPLVTYGVNRPEPYEAYARPGSATLRPKTLHRLLNELLASWAAEGFEEFILLTASTYDLQAEAMASVQVRRARVRVLELLRAALRPFLTDPHAPEHGGEALTSLLLYLRPDLVRMDRARDAVPRGRRRGAVPLPGHLGRPSLATAEKGAAMYRYLFDLVSRRLEGRTEPSVAVPVG